MRCTAASLPLKKMGPVSVAGVTGEGIGDAIVWDWLSASVRNAAIVPLMLIRLVLSVSSAVSVWPSSRVVNNPFSQSADPSLN